MDQDPPAWIATLIEEEAEVLSGMLGLPRVPFIELEFEGPTDIAGQRIIQAEAEHEKVSIWLSGDWHDITPAARNQVIGNLAHELAHVWQYTLGTPGESRFFHEGFAEAIAIDVLKRCGEGCGGAPEALFRSQQMACADALRDGALLVQSSAAAVYGCGTVLAHHASEKAGTTPQELYLQFAATERTKSDFLAVTRAMAGQPFATSAFTFLHSDHSLGQPSRVMSLLREGKL